MDKPNKNITRLMLLVLTSSLIVVLPQNIDANDWLSNWRKATVAIGVIDQREITDTKTGEKRKLSYFKVIGTGIICSNPNPEDKLPYLLTAKHVFEDVLLKWYPNTLRIRFSWFENYSVTENLGLEIRLKDDKNRPLWIEHPNTEIDLAILKIVVLETESLRRSIESMKTQDIAKENEIFEGAPVLVFGYPGAVGALHWTRPVVRSGIVSWIPKNDPDSSHFLIDAMIFPGNSGGPVFRAPTGLTKEGSFQISGTGRASLIGIVSSASLQPVKLEQTSKNSGESMGNFISLDYMGLASVVSAREVLELLNHLKNIKEGEGSKRTSNIDP